MTYKPIDNRIYPITTWINGDEKAFWLTETHWQSPTYSGFHRYQTLYVVRGDKLAEFRIDMGDAKNFKGVKHISIPSYMEHTVSELQDIADEMRYEKKVDFMDLLKLDKVNLA